jgi:fatty acid desaturase
VRAWDGRWLLLLGEETGPRDMRARRLYGFARSRPELAVRPANLEPDPAELLRELCELGLAAEAVLLWSAPLLTVYQVILRIRGILEHAAVPDKDDPLRSARTVVTANPVARFFLNPHHVAWHLEHHLYPGVPHYRLPALECALRATGAYGAAHVQAGYRSAFAELITG